MYLYIERKLEKIVISTMPQIEIPVFAHLSDNK